MPYITSITFPSDNAESDFICGIQRTCYDSYYPFRTLAINGITRLDFEPITILYGGNGSGKSTALNVIAEKLKLTRDSAFNKSNFYPDYINMCLVEAEKIPKNSRIITSDDVFDYILNIRNINEGIDQKRDELFEDYLETKYTSFQMRTMEDYEKLKKAVSAKSKTQSRYVRSIMPDNVPEFSNGESAYKYFTEKIGENALYILDEPENSLSPKRQAELVQFIFEAVRFYNCQIIMSTHSPFFLATRSAKIYNLDENPAAVRHWTQLENVRLLHDFFEQHSKEFAK